jgi:hypothetical protein
MLPWPRNACSGATAPTAARVAVTKAARGTPNRSRNAISGATSPRNGGGSRFRSGGADAAGAPAGATTKGSGSERDTQDAEFRQHALDGQLLINRFAAVKIEAGQIDRFGEALYTGSA